MTDKIEPTTDELRNGWDAQSLSAYLAEREKARNPALDIHSPQRRKRPNVQNHKYRPHRWRE